MISRGAAAKVMSIGAGLLMLLGLAACGSQDPDPTGKARARALEDQAQTQQEQELARTVTGLIENFREGPTPPEGWPGDIIPVPQGAKPVASLQRSSLPNGAETMSMFYASDDQPADVQRAFRTELPKKGWVEVKPAEDGELTIVTAQNGDYNGLFMAGPIPSVPRLQSREIINVLVVLTRPGASPAAPPPIP